MGRKRINEIERETGKRKGDGEEDVKLMIQSKIQGREMGGMRRKRISK